MIANKLDLRTGLATAMEKCYIRSMFGGFAISKLGISTAKREGKRFEDIAHWSQYIYAHLFVYSHDKILYSSKCQIDFLLKKNRNNGTNTHQK